MKTSQTSLFMRKPCFVKDRFEMRTFYSYGKYIPMADWRYQVLIGSCYRYLMYHSNFTIRNRLSPYYIWFKASKNNFCVMWKLFKKHKNDFTTLHVMNNIGTYVYVEKRNNRKAMLSKQIKKTVKARSKVFKLRFKRIHFIAVAFSIGSTIHIYIIRYINAIVILWIQRFLRLGDPSYSLVSKHHRKCLFPIAQLQSLLLLFPVGLTHI